MFLSTYQLSEMLQLTPQGTAKLLKRLRAPLQLFHNKWRLDLSNTHPICRSFQLQRYHNHLKVIYSIKNLAIRFGKDKRPCWLCSENPIYLSTAAPRSISCCMIWWCWSDNYIIPETTEDIFTLLEGITYGSHFTNT